LSFVFLASCLAMEKRKSSYSSGFWCSWPLPNNFWCGELLNDGPKNPSCNLNPISNPSCSLSFLFYFYFLMCCFFLGWEYLGRSGLDLRFVGRKKAKLEFDRAK
jgi:hypothetical protein